MRYSRISHLSWQHNLSEVWLIINFYYLDILLCGKNESHKWVTCWLIDVVAALRQKIFRILYTLKLTGVFHCASYDCWDKCCWYYNDWIYEYGCYMWFSNFKKVDMVDCAIINTGFKGAFIDCIFYCIWQGILLTHILKEIQLTPFWCL